MYSRQIESFTYGANLKVRSGLKIFHVGIDDACILISSMAFRLYRNRCFQIYPKFSSRNTNLTKLPRARSFSSKSLSQKFAELSR